MIFDAEEFNEVYMRYLRYEDPIDLGNLCDAVNDLIEAIASSISSEYVDDLIQEGQLKFIQLIKSGMIDPKRGSVYSFLSFSLKNHMIDFLRATDSSLELKDTETVRTAIDIDEDALKTALLDYTYERFPSIDAHTIERVTEYVYEAIREEVKGKARGIIKTLVSAYDFNRSQAYIIYHSCLIFLRCETLGLTNYDAMHSVLDEKGKEFTLVPDVAYAIGHNYNSQLFLVMKGSYVKF